VRQLPTQVPMKGEEFLSRRNANSLNYLAAHGKIQLSRGRQIGAD
jgi:hypothetical protein